MKLKAQKRHAFEVANDAVGRFLNLDNFLRSVEGIDIESIKDMACPTNRIDSKEYHRAFQKVYDVLSDSQKGLLHDLDIQAGFNNAAENKVHVVLGLTLGLRLAGATAAEIEKITHVIQLWDV